MLGLGLESGLGLRSILITLKNFKGVSPGSFLRFVLENGEKSLAGGVFSRGLRRGGFLHFLLHNGKKPLAWGDFSGGDFSGAGFLGGGVLRQSDFRIFPKKYF